MLENRCCDEGDEVSCKRLEMIAYSCPFGAMDKMEF